MEASTRYGIEMLTPTSGEAIMLINLSIIVLSNSHNFAHYAHRLTYLFQNYIVNLMFMALQKANIYVLPIYFLNV